MEPALPREDDPVWRAARAVGGLFARWHRAICDGLHHLPEGKTLLVGNHGIYGFEAPTFFHLLHRATGRTPLGLADRRVFGWQPMRSLLARCGGHIGTMETALALLRQQQLVVCYPGGAHEVFKAPGQRYRLCWERASGFARLAIWAQAPIVPFAGLGVDDSYINFGHLPGTRALLGRYAAPFAVGLGPLPLPVRFRFQLGAPIMPPRDIRDAAALKEEVAAAVRSLLESANQPASDEEPTHGDLEEAAASFVY